MRTITTTIPDPLMYGGTVSHTIEVEDDYAEQQVNAGQATYADEAKDETDSDTTGAPEHVATAEPAAEADPAAAAKPKRAPKADTPPE